MSHDPLHIQNTAPRIKSDQARSQGQCNVGDRIQMAHNSSPAPEQYYVELIHTVIQNDM